MSKFFSIALFLIVLACNNQAESDKTVTTKETESNQNESTSANGLCGNSLLFRKGAEIETSSFDGQGKLMGNYLAVVRKVSQQDGMSISEVEMSKMDAADKPFTAIYKCDGQKLYVDLSSLMSGSGGNSRIETSGLEFPLKATVGETLPDAEYAVVISQGDSTRTIKSHIKERKVESQEEVTTPAGTFNCFKITSLIETDMNFAGMDEESKKVMEQVRGRMGKTRMTFWYAPEQTIIKMELRMGDKIMSRTEVTKIKK
jgi:hypothetical protein